MENSGQIHKGKSTLFFFPTEQTKAECEHISGKLISYRYIFFHSFESKDKLS